jgi:predicted nucleic acid-binding protein
LGLISLRAFLKKHRRIALDTSIFIYYLEEAPAYADMAGQVFSWLERPGHSAVTSTITMTEVLVHPYLDANEILVNQYYGLLTPYPNLEWIPPDLEIADTAARLRARHRLLSPDALQLATAICRTATGFLTNDQDLCRVTAIDVGILSQLG